MTDETQSVEDENEGPLTEDQYEMLIDRLEAGGFLLAGISKEGMLMLIEPLQVYDDEDDAREAIEHLVTEYKDSGDRFMYFRCEAIAKWGDVVWSDE